MVFSIQETKSGTLALFYGVYACLLASGNGLAVVRNVYERVFALAIDIGVCFWIEIYYDILHYSCRTGVHKKNVLILHPKMGKKAGKNTFLMLNVGNVPELGRRRKPNGPDRKRTRKQTRKRRVSQSRNRRGAVHGMWKHANLRAPCSVFNACLRFCT